MVKIPTNYNYWLFVLRDENSLEQFYDRGTKRQIKCIIASLLHLKKSRPTQYNLIFGSKLLAKFKKRGK